MTWIRVPITRRVVVKNDNQQVVQVVMGRRPIIKYRDCEFYPRSWQGITRQSGELVSWEFSMGPVRSVHVHGNRWIRIVWR